MIRIVGGELKGRKLRTVPGHATRPMLDRVRQAVADILTAHFAGALVWDLFAGTGANGFEALSRGARQVVFVERARAALRVLEQNLASLPASARERCQVRRGDGWRPPPASAAPDLVFCDPPYAQARDAALAGRLAPLLHALAPDGVLVLHAPRDALRAEDLSGLGEVDLRAWGTSAVAFLRRPSSSAD